MKLRSGKNLDYEQQIKRGNNGNKTGILLKLIYFGIQFISVFIVNIIFITTILFIFTKITGV